MEVLVDTEIDFFVCVTGRADARGLFDVWLPADKGLWRDAP